MFRRGELDDATQVLFSVFPADDAGAHVEELRAEPVSERVVKWARSSTWRASVAEPRREVDARLQQVTHRAIGAKAADEGLGLADLARVEVESGLDGVDEGAQVRPIAFMQQTAQIVDDREGRFETVRRRDRTSSRRLMTRYANAGWSAVISLDLRDHSTGRDEFVAIGQDAEQCDVSIDRHEVRGHFERGRGGERPLAVFCGRAEVALTKRNARAHAMRENRGRHLRTMDRTAQRLVCSLRIVDQQVRTRQIRADLFSGYTELDASVDVVDGSLPAFEAGLVRRLPR